MQTRFDAADGSEFAFVTGCFCTVCLREQMHPTHHLRTNTMRLLSLLFALAFTLSACTSDDPVAPPEIVTPIVPGIGSTYTYASYETDANNTKVAGSDRQTTFTVVGTGLTHRGLPNVWAVASGSSSDTLYFAIDDSNDVWFLPSGAGNITYPWTKLPQSTGDIWITRGTGSIEIGGTKLATSTKVTVSNVATETIKVNNTNVLTHKLDVNMTITFSVSGQENTTAVMYTLSYAPALGTYARVNAKAQQIDGSIENGTFEELTSYSLK